MAIKKAKVLTITSVKGGVGKTTFLLNLAGALSNIQRKVLIIDLDLTGGDIAMALNKEITVDIYKLVSDFSNNKFTFIEDYTLKYNNNIYVLSAPKDPRYASKINIKYLNVILSKATMRYDYVLIDTSHILNDMSLVAMDYSDYLLYIINSSPLDVKNMKTMTSILKDMDYHKFLVILNNALSKHQSLLTPFDIKNIIKHDIDYIIPSTFYLKRSDKYIMDGQIPIFDKKNEKHIKLFNDIINHIEKIDE